MEKWPEFMRGLVVLVSVNFMNFIITVLLYYYADSAPVYYTPIHKCDHILYWTSKEKKEKNRKITHDTKNYPLYSTCLYK
jgi:hypothetical protein